MMDWDNSDDWRIGHAAKGIYDHWSDKPRQVVLSRYCTAITMSEQLNSLSHTAFFTLCAGMMFSDEEVAVEIAKRRLGLEE